MRNIESTFLKLRKFVSDTELISVDRWKILLACRGTHLYSLVLLKVLVAQNTRIIVYLKHNDH